jgi:hypothetical protein
MNERRYAVLDKATLEVFRGEHATMARAAWRVELARELAEIGMELARALRRQVLERAAQDQWGDTGNEPPADIGLTFSRIARAVRLSLALEEHFDEAQQGCLERAQAAGEARAKREAAAKKAALEARIKAGAERAIEVEVAERLERGERPRREWLLENLDVALEDDREWRMLARGPLVGVVAHICRLLKVPFDPADWVEDADGELVLDIDPPDPPDDAAFDAPHPAEFRPASGIPEHPPP